MTKLKHIGPDPKKLYTYIELPIGDVGIGLPPERRKTGLWRYMRPVFESKIPPCQDACPLGNWVQKFVTEVSQEKLNEAWSALRLENPFPGLCGRICHHPCEAACNRKELDGTVSIQAIERYLADHFFDKPMKPPVIREKQGKKTAVVGSGPAGLACAYFLILLGYDVTVFEAQNTLGGIPQIAIPAYRMPRDVLNKEIQDILSLGIEVRSGCRVGKDIEFSELLRYDAVFLAPGAHRELLLEIPGEDLDGVYRSLDFLSRFNLKESIDVGKRVIVIGGGNVAVDVVMTSVRLGVEEVSLVCLENRDKMPAWEHQIEEALEEGVNIINGLGPKRFLQKDGQLAGIELKRCTSVFDEEGSFNPQYDETDLTTIDADTVIVAIGQASDLSFGERQGLSVRPRGRLKVNPATLETSIQGVFAGGDIIDQHWSVSDAVGSAKKAAIAMDHYLRGRELREISEKGILATTMREHLGLDENAVLNSQQVAIFQDLNVAYVSLSPRYIPKKLPPDDRIKNFEEITVAMNPEEAVQEAGRCMSCGVCRMCANCYLFCPDGVVQLDTETGRYAIDYDYCKGCGVCQNECQCGVLVMKTEGEV